MVRSFVSSLRDKDYTVFVVRSTDWPSVQLPLPEPEKYPAIPCVTKTGGSSNDVTSGFITFDVAQNWSSESFNTSKCAHQWPSSEGRWVSEIIHLFVRRLDMATQMPAAIQSEATDLEYESVVALSAKEYQNVRTPHIISKPLQ